MCSGLEISKRKAMKELEDEAAGIRSYLGEREMM
jgi:phage gp36-like protein